MISLNTLLNLAQAYGADLEVPVAKLAIGTTVFDLDARPAVMGTINLSRDSTYRESIATSTASAIRKGRVLAAQGADILDIGAESTTAKAARVGAPAQIAALVPVIEQLSAQRLIVSVESYDPTVARAAVEAGAKVLNLTGQADQDEMFELAAEFEVAVILCYVKGRNVREITDVSLSSDPIPELLDHFGSRIERARTSGVRSIVIDPGMGFYYGNLVDPVHRVKHQARVLLNSFRLRRLGVPICNAMPHAFDLFEDQFRAAEGFFTVLACLGGTGVIRTHEVPQIMAVLRGLAELDPGFTP